MDRARTLVILGLMPAYWWMKLFLQLVLAHWCVESGPRFSGCMASGVPGLVPMHWCVWGLVLGPLGDRTKSQGSYCLRMS